MHAILNKKKGALAPSARYIYLSCLLIMLLFLTTFSTSEALAGKTSTGNATQFSSEYHATIDWDTWGVPHIFAADNTSLFYAFGWAQMHNQADLLLTLYGEARGQAAEYWGSSYLSSDEFVRTMGFPEHAQQWLDAQTPEFRAYIQAFVAGMNTYASQHPEEISSQLKVVLPVKATDVFAHAEHALSEFLLGNCSPALSSFNTPPSSAGSNGWAIGPGHSASGHAMLLANPHLPWSDAYTFFEAQLVSPTVSTYGATLVGFPVLAIAFNNFLSWTHTVNTMDGCDGYQLTLSGNGYLFDGAVRSFDTQTETLSVKQSDGTLQQQQLVVRRSIQGPVFVLGSGSKAETFAIRMVGVEQFPVYGIWQEWWDMGRARNLSEFQAALSRLQIPMFTVIYADRDGHVLSLFNGEVPKHPTGDWNYWQNLVPGDTSTTLWTSILSYNDLPKVIDPSGDWVQNSNSPPWYTTIPQALNPQNFPADMAPTGPLSFREQRGISMITAQSSISFDQMVNDKFSSNVEMANRILDDLIAAARTYGDAQANSAADTLQKWDRSTDANSVGSALFYLWTLQMDQNNTEMFAVPWDPQHPLTTPSGLADPQASAQALSSAASTLISLTGSLDVSWGTVFRLHRGQINLPASGGPGDPYGIFRALDFTPGAGGEYDAVGGDSYIAAVEFTTPVHAQVLLTYGNSSQPDSPHNGDQLALYAKNQLRDAWTTLPAIMAHLAEHESF